MGRHSTYTPELGATICEYLAIGESVRTVCKREGMPEPTTVYDWLRKHEDFAKQYARAKITGAEALAAELMDIADDGTNDFVKSEDPDNPGYALNGEHVQRSRLRVDTRKWYLSKILPKVYGDRLALDHSGSLEISDALLAARKRSGE